MTSAATVLQACRVRGWMIATAESCTGGMIAAALTDVPGSSDVVDCGFVTYSNSAKQALLGVPASTLTDHGAVSAQVACAMAQGALDRSQAHVAVAVTGIAGPGGGSTEKPEGLVWFAVATRDTAPAAQEHLFGPIGRAEVRTATVEVALELVLQAATNT